MSDRVWSIKLADADNNNNNDNTANSNDDAKKVNSDRILLMSVWSSGAPLTVSQVCRKAVESSPEWMLKIAHRFHRPKTKKDRAAVLQFQYGAGYETLLLLDGATLPNNMSATTAVVHPIAIESVVAPVASEDSLEEALQRRQKYGVNSFWDEMQDHCCHVQSNEVAENDTTGVRIYLYASHKQLPRTGGWDEDKNLNRKHVFRMETNPKNKGEIILVEQCDLLEEQLRHAETNRKQQAATGEEDYEKVGPIETSTMPAKRKPTSSSTTAAAKKAAAAPQAKKTTAASSAKKTTEDEKKTPATTKKTTPKAKKTSADKETPASPAKTTTAEATEKTTPAKKKRAPRPKKTETTAEEAPETPPAPTETATKTTTSAKGKRKTTDEAHESSKKKRKSSSTSKPNDKPKKRSKKADTKTETEQEV